jgi:hypothetical protein
LSATVWATHSADVPAFEVADPVEASDNWSLSSADTVGPIAEGAVLVLARS